MADRDGDGEAGGGKGDSSDALLRLIARHVALDGPMTVADFMGLALGHPTHGYYMTRDPLGRGGDFTTAPEISQMHGELLGLWAAEVWRLMGRPTHVHLVEFGPGRGTLMADALRAAAMMPGFREALRVTLIETSPVLTGVQRRTLADRGVSVTWGTGLADVPDDGAPLIAVGNEFFDALPIRQFQRTREGWRERLVACDPEGGGLVFALAPGPGLAEALLPPAVREGAPVGAVAEVAPAAWAVARDLGERIADRGGAALFLDYGHGRSAAGDTLQAVRDHDYCGLLAHVGQADLTAHVDFEQLARAFGEAGCRAAPLATQGEFLRALGIEQRAAILARSGDPAAVAAARDRLIGAEGMGTLFKVLGVAAPGLPALPGLEPEEGAA
ncbi:SAM-dependent methyltransferase [Marivibrio halodurans]|uniref:SAM-dependent methyltransferase n=1 Tax=Marivibrio halodurans TaxID=2039722 RepID=A0A8J7V3Y5_9PROT|nr:SAM-dependent methyltransferase [Marivibrio halodurans]MBP5858522.1 SAM-dependent methyltransferase [Marivibrio halodurans]